VLNPGAAEFVHEDQELSETPRPIDKMAWANLQGLDVPALTEGLMRQARQNQRWSTGSAPINPSFASIGDGSPFAAIGGDDSSISAISCG
jgi:hypothetical protein